MSKLFRPTRRRRESLYRRTLEGPARPRNHSAHEALEEDEVLEGAPEAGNHAGHVLQGTLHHLSQIAVR